MSYSTTYKVYQLEPKFKTIDKIRSFTDHPAGWHFGSGKPADGKSVMSAIYVCENYYLSGFIETDAFFGEFGDIAITAYHQKYFVEVIVRTDGLYDVLFEHEDRKILREEEVSAITLSQRLRNIKNEIWPGSEYSTQGITINEKAALQALRFVILPEKAAYQSWRSHASWQEALVFANISTSSMKTLRVTPLFIGQSDIKMSRHKDGLFKKTATLGTSVTTIC